MISNAIMGMKIALKAFFPNEQLLRIPRRGGAKSKTLQLDPEHYACYVRS